MADVSDADKKAIGEKWAQSLQPHAAAFAGASPAATAAGVNPKDVFCKEWPTIKTVLEWLQGIVPQPGPIIIKLVITAGDAAHSTICK